jgi:diguanylate cyclase (GGDEF)-like protein
MTRRTISGMTGPTTGAMTHDTPPHAGAPAPGVAASPYAWLRALPQPAWVLRRPDARVLAANDAAAALLGLTAQALLALPATALLRSVEDMAWWADDAAPPLHGQTWVQTPDGRTLAVTRSLQPLPAADAGAGTDPVPWLLTLHDRTAEHEAESAREALLAELQATLESTADGLLVTDLHGGIRAFNRRFAELWAVPEALLLAPQRDDTALLAWMHGQATDPAAHRRRFDELAAAALPGPARERIELAGSRVLERVSRPLQHGGRVQGRVWSFRDLTERLADQARIEALTFADPLTGLGNRRALREAVDRAALRARQHGEGFVLLLVDLDRFRRVNDTLGHQAGDAVLKEVARRLRAVLRGDDRLARLAGDQFVALVRPASARAMESTARRLLKAVAQPCEIEGERFTLTASIGAALCPAHGQTLDELLGHAETALRSAKANGRGGWRLQTQRQALDRRHQLKLEHALRQALSAGRLRLHYQPRVACADGRLLGAEALLRWRDPELGEVSPAVFIPVAEDSGLINDLGDWVLSQAVRQAALWHAAGHALPVAVNVSALQFQQPQFAERVAGVLAVSGLPPHLLELELTESVLLHDVEEALLRLHALAALGVGLAIDDFGTGYSSLAYLKRLPVGTLKIDRSFVAGLPGDAADAGIVGAILQMARALQMEVIAEGVETEAQRAFLAGAGCGAYQGWLCAPALDALSFERRMLPAGEAAEADAGAGAETAPAGAVAGGDVAPGRAVSPARTAVAPRLRLVGR